MLKISGAPYRSRASSKASTQNGASIVFDNLQDSTLRVAQSMMATKYKNPRCIGSAKSRGGEELALDSTRKKGERLRGRRHPPTPVSDGRGLPLPETGRSHFGDPLARRAQI